MKLIIKFTLFTLLNSRAMPPPPPPPPLIWNHLRIVPIFEHDNLFRECCCPRTIHQAHKTTQVMLDTLWYLCGVYLLLWYSCECLLPIFSSYTIATDVVSIGVKL